MRSAGSQAVANVLWAVARLGLVPPGSWVEVCVCVCMCVCVHVCVFVFAFSKTKLVIALSWQVRSAVQHASAGLTYIPHAHVLKNESSCNLES